MIDDESIKRIEKLHQLKNEGIISETDFETAKQRLLLGSSPRPAKIVGLEQISGPVILPNDADFVGWVTLPLRRYADFTGRSSRKEFWMFQLIYLALFVACLVSSIFGGSVAAALLVLGVLGLIVPQTAVHVRRFHDQDRSGWFTLLALIPYLGPFILFAFMLVEGTHGVNQFGPDPIAR